jgi:hypothetical protein
MKKWLTKKNVFIASGAYIVFFLAIFLLAYVCDNKDLCEIREDEFPGILIGIFAPLFFSFIFSVVTYKMPESVFQNWVKFAAWAIPMLVILSFFVAVDSNNGFGVEGVIGGAFDLLVLGIFYVMFIGISIWKIAAVYDKLKGK